MTETGHSELEKSHIMLGLLRALDGERPLSQRSLAAELGIALGRRRTPTPGHYEPGASGSNLTLGALA